MNRFRNLSLFLVILLISGCATTPSDLPQKWETSKRAEAHVELGFDYLRRGQFDVAREELDLAISIDPKSDRAYHGKGLLMAQTGYVEEATQLFARAVSLNSSNYLAANDYGIYLCRNGGFDTGIEILQRAEARPDNELLTNTQLGLGICNFEQGNAPEAKQHFRNVLRALPRLPQALLPMAEIAFQEQNFLSARAFVERYIAAGALSEKALVIGANTELMLGDKEKARQYARELRRAYPSSSQNEKFRPLLKSG